MQADIAIAPLENNYFNKFKSQCKYLEYSINKIPAVYSDWFYGHKGKNKALFANTKEEWIERLERLIKSKDLRKYKGEQAYQDVIKNHQIENKLSNWQNFIENI